MDKIDVVIPFRENSIWNNNELRFTLRSIERYLKHYNRLHLVGSIPDFIDRSKVVCHHVGDYSWSATNIMTKVLYMCTDTGEERPTENFLFTNDDIFFLRDTDARFYPYYYESNLKVLAQTFSPASTYKHNILNTAKALETDLDMIKNFDIHVPIRYNRMVFKTIMNRYDWTIKFGYLIKTLYCENAGIEPVGYKDLKMRAMPTMAQIKVMTHNRDVFSISDECINKSLEKFLSKLFPTKSQFEL